MDRVGAALLVVAVLVGGLIVGGLVTAETAVQSTPEAGEHSLIGSWLVDETNPPAGGEPVLAAVASFFDDGNALISGFGDSRYQGSWISDGDHTATVTVVAPSTGGFGQIDRLRAAIEVAPDGGSFQGTYSYDLVSADGSISFTYRGPIEGSRVEVQAPDPYP